MKGTIETRRQDGQVDSTPFMLPLKKATPSIELKMLAPTNEEPIAVYYFETGWNYGYPTYHVIIEYGDFEQTDNLFMSHKEFVEKFGVDPLEDENRNPLQAEFDF